MDVRPIGPGERAWPAGRLRAVWGSTTIVSRGSQAARRLKLQIPQIGAPGIPIRDEIELSLRLSE